jgi:hypothetical protein
MLHLRNWRVCCQQRLTLIKELALDCLKIGILIDTLAAFHVRLSSRSHRRHLTIRLGRHWLRWGRVLTWLLGMPLHMSTVVNTATKVRLGHATAATSATSPNIAIARLMNLVRCAHYTLLGSCRNDHTCWFLILNWPLSILNLFLRNWLNRQVS